MPKQLHIPQFSVDDLNLRQALDVMFAHVWIKDLNGVYVYTNSASMRSSGIASEDIIGKTDFEIYDAKTAKFFLSSDKVVLDSGRECHFPRFSHHTDAISAEFMKAPLHNVQGEVIGLIGMGMTYDPVDKGVELEHDALYRLAYNDSLTGVSNRVRLKLDLETMLEESKKITREIAVISIDLDFFQRINESFGHVFGDHLLKKIAQLLQEYVPKSALIARVDGDEFVIAFFCDNTESNCAVNWIHQLQQVFNKPFIIDEHELRLSVSFGVTTYPQDADNVDDLLRNVGAAKTKAKYSGRNRYEFYTQGSRELAARHVEIQTYLHKAISGNNFFLVYQGKYALADQTLRGYEALIRLDIPELGSVSPVEFIPLAESSGLIIDIGFWVIEQACIQGVKWLQEGKEFGHISVNVSVEQLKHQDFIKQVKCIIKRTGFLTQYLEMEITESVLMNESSNVIKILHKLRMLGISLSMDDFGTGYSSLSYLKDLPLSKLKLDRAFVQDLVVDKGSSAQSSEAIVQATIALADAFNLELVAEGIETSEQAERLLELGCQYGQGFLYHKPQRF